MLKQCVMAMGLLIASAGQAQTVLGLSDGTTLLRFPAEAPGVLLASTPVTGLAAGESLLGIDVRPATGEVYALSDGGRLYRIDPVSGAATLASMLNIALSGARFAVDFNPVPDRLRVISDSGQNLRINVDTGETIVDGAINPAGPMIGGAAYINSVAGAATTALYDIDVGSSQLLLQSPPNDGTVTTVGSLGLSLDAGSSVGFDVLTRAGSDLAFAVLRSAGSTGLYRLNLATGAATLVGPVAGNPNLHGMAVLGEPLQVPPPAAATAIGLSVGNQLIRFPAGAPAAVQAPTQVTGLAPGETLVGLDIRPATGQLYALSSASRLYTVDPVSGAATLASTLSIPLSGSRFGVDFNPVPDRLRVVSDAGQNLRINVDTGETLNDGAINPAGPQLSAAAYINSVAGAASTALFVIDPASGQLLLQSPPNDGVVRSIGALGASPEALAGFDVLSSGGRDSALAVLRVGGVTGLYAIDLGSGAAQLLDAIGGNPSLLGLAVSPQSLTGLPPAAPRPAVVPANAPQALLLMLLGVLGLGWLGLARRA